MSSSILYLIAKCKAEVKMHFYIQLKWLPPQARGGGTLDPPLPCFFYPLLKIF